MTVERGCRSLVFWVQRLAAPPALGAALFLAQPALAESQTGFAPPNCAKDAMIVFDASGSMTGMGFGDHTVRRIEKVQRALARVLPDIAPMRNLGLVVFGPGPRQACQNVDVRLPPGPNSAARIMSEVRGVQPYGQTPLTGAVTAAAEALAFRERPAVIVLLTDGEETCRGEPCSLAGQLKHQGHDVTVHVIGYMLGHASEPNNGQFARCLSEGTGGMFISTETTEELVEALRRTLGCPIMSSLDRTGEAAR